MTIRVAKAFVTMTLSACILVSASGISTANHWQWKHDGNDTQGLMDLKRAGISIPGHKTSGDKGVVSCRGDFFEDLTPEQVTGFYCYYDTKGDDEFEYGMLGLWNGAKLAATAYKYKHGIEDGSFPVKIFMKDGDVVMEIPRKKMHGRDTFLRWRMYAYSDAGDDNAPNAVGNYYKYDFPK